MTKYFILNIALNFGIIFLLYSAYMSYQSGNQLFLFLSVALLVVLIYLKVVLFKIVKKRTAATKEKPTEVLQKKGTKA
ncbi:DUF6358 family protein [Sphingobacterium sp. LRF_L2]|uniref:DUF6358 family protein n=1 Tax=Sphingobacterium sp. LRF_L2 TaxID=3369421 RepID=UPI003F635E3A